MILVITGLLVISIALFLTAGMITCPPAPAERHNPKVWLHWALLTLLCLGLAVYGALLVWWGTK